MLTVRQRECLNFIEARTLAGRPPTFRELKLDMRTSSTSNVVAIVSRLQARGFVRRMPGARGIHVLKPVGKPTLDLGRHEAYVVERIDGEARLVKFPPKP